MRDRLRPGLLPGALGYASERATRLVISAVVGIFVARHLGPDGYGLLSYASGVFSLMGPLALLGMQQVLVRDFSTRENWRPVLTSAVVAQAPTAVIAALAGLLVIVVTRGGDQEALLLGLVMSPVPLFGLSESVRAYFEAAGRIRRIVVTGIAATTAAAALKVAGLLLDAPVWMFGAFATAEIALVFGGLLGGLPGRKRIAAVRRHFQRDTARRLLRESWPLLLSAIAVTVYLKADLLMLGIIAGDEETGIYAAAARVSEVWYFIPVSAAAAIRPQLARLFSSEEHDRYRLITQRFMSGSAGASLLAIAVVLLLADPIVRFLFGVEFLEASQVLRIHILAAPFVFLGVAGSQWFIDRNMTRDVLVRSATGAVLNVLVNLALIPTYGAVGASIATLIAYASGVFINLLPPRTRPLFRMQLRALRLHWPRDDRGS